MEYVYLIFDTNGFRMACKNEIDATLKVNSIAHGEYGIDDSIPPDYSGALYRYGWDEAVWWVKEIIY